MEKFFFGDAELLVLNKGDGFSFLGGDIKGMKVEPSSLFTVKAKNTDTKEIFWLEGKGGWSKATAETKGDKTLFTLSDNEAFLGLTVKITFKTEGRALLIDTEVENKNDTLSVLDITYPVPTLSADHFDVFYPQASGCVAKDAGNKGLTYGNPYPEHHACMQYFAAYNEVGGLYIGIEDPTASTKHFIVKAENGKVRFYPYFYAPGGGKPANSFKLAGVCRLEAFEGDWYEASQIYARFVKSECKWLPELGEKIDFSVSYAKNAQVAVVKKGSTLTADGVAAAKIAVENGSAGATVAEETLKATKINKVTAQVDALGEVLSGASDVAVIDITMAQSVVGKGAYADLQILDGASYGDEIFAVGLRKDSDLKAELDAFLKAKYADGTLAALAEKYSVGLNTEALK